MSVRQVLAAAIQQRQPVLEHPPVRHPLTWLGTTERSSHEWPVGPLDGKSTYQDYICQRVFLDFCGFGRSAECMGGAEGLAAGGGRRLKDVRAASGGSPLPTLPRAGGRGKLQPVPFTLTLPRAGGWVEGREGRRRRAPPLPALPRAGGRALGADGVGEEWVRGVATGEGKTKGPAWLLADGGYSLAPGH